MRVPGEVDSVRPTLVLHQEGVIAVVALVGLAFTERGPLGGLAPVGRWEVGLGAGALIGLLLAGAMWLLRLVPALAELESFQRRLVGAWSPGDAVAIAVLSGAAEEALIRALLQPVLGLVAAAALFALLHLVPDRRLWPWPVMAFGMGLGFGALFERWGWPAAAAAHTTVNLVGLLRLCR